MALTKKLIDSFVYDGRSMDFRPDGIGGIPNFGVRVYKAGTKSFVLGYRRAGSRKQEWITIGRYGVMALQQARQRAREILIEVGKGVDPKGTSNIKTITLKDFASLFLEEMRKREKKSVEAMRRQLDKNIVPALGSKRMSEIRRADVHKLHGSIKAKIEANRNVSLVSIMFLWAERMGYVEENHPNPARGIERYAEKSRTRFLDDAELKRLIDSMKEEPQTIQTIIWLYLLTGVRKNELLGLRWEDVDLDSPQPSFFVGNTKSGRDLNLQLAPQAVALFRQLKAHAHSPFCFPSPTRHMRPIADIKDYWARIRERAGLQDVRIHDLRRTCGTKMAEAGVPLHTISTVLNHSDSEVTKVYARIADNVQREALEAVGDNLEDVLGKIGIPTIAVVA